MRKRICAVLSYGFYYGSIPLAVGIPFLFLHLWGPSPLTAGVVITFVILTVPICFLLSSLFAVIGAGQPLSWENIKRDFWQCSDF